MADSKISALTELAEIAADNDVFGLVDTSASETKKHSIGYVRRYDVDAIVATGSITCISKQFITLDLGTAMALTILAAPTKGDELEIIRDGSGAVTHTVVLSGSVTWDGTNQTASFDTDEDSLRAIAISATRWRIVRNVGVTFSA